MQVTQATQAMQARTQRDGIGRIDQATTRGPRWAAWGLLSVVMILGTAAGCNTPDPGARNTLGNISAAVPATPTEVVAATERVLRRMDVTIIASNATEVDGRVTARSPRRRPVDVRVTEDVDNHSRVSIRVGAFGDENASVGLLRRIRAELKRDPAEYEGFDYQFERHQQPEQPEEANETAEPDGANVDDESIRST